MKRTQGTRAVTVTGKQEPSAGPQRLGRYVIERRIGRGAMGAVYLAKDPRINRPVALKAIPIEKEFEDEELKEARLRFYREAESAGRLAHPNIITVFDAGEDKGLAYIAMEYVPGIPLTKFTDPKKLLAPKRALELCASTAEALDYAHNQGVIHRDIKPANLMYNPKEGSLKITDFGVARMTDNNSTKTGIVLGTPMYMSPEQLGRRRPDRPLGLVFAWCYPIRTLGRRSAIQGDEHRSANDKNHDRKSGADFAKASRNTAECGLRVGQSIGQTASGSVLMRRRDGDRVT